MTSNDFCRLCHVNMRIAGIYRHSTSIFEKHKKPLSINEQLQNIGLTVKQEMGQSDRSCQRCVSTLTRLERDLPVFRRWETEYGKATAPAPVFRTLETERGEATASAAIAKKRRRRPTPSKTPRALKKLCPKPASPRRNGGTSPNSTAKTVAVEMPCLTTVDEDDKDADPETKAPSLLREPMKMAQDAASFGGSFIQPRFKQIIVLDVLSNTHMFSAVDLKNGPFLHQATQANGFDVISNSPPKINSHPVCSAQHGLSPSPSVATPSTVKLQSEEMVARFSCSKCSLTFYQENHLHNHMKSHADVNPFVCLECGESFKQTHSLMEHMSIHWETRIQVSPVALQESKRMFDQIKTEEEEELINSEIKEECIETEIMAETIDTHRVEESLDEYSKKNVPQQQDNKEEVLTDQHLCDQERISALDHVEPESFHIKEDVDEIPISQEETHLVLKQEADTLTLDNGESGQIKSELGGDHQLLSHCSLVMGIQDQTGSKDEKDLFKTEEDVHYHQQVSDVFWQPKIELPQLHVSQKEDVLSNHQLCQQQENRNHQKISISQKSLSLKDRTIVLTCHHEESDNMETETDSEQQLLSPVAERQDQIEISLRDSESLSEKQVTRPNNSHICFQTRNICNICNQSFKWKSLLVLHMRTHTGEKPFWCETCGKSFSQQSSFKSHVRIHTGEKPFSCETCRKCFSQLNSFTNHMRIHTGEKPFTCNICGKSFPQNSNLKLHMRTHTGEKPFSCKTCGKSFPRNCNLKLHTRTHTGEKPFSCETCGKCFSDRSSFRRHMRTHRRETVSL